MEQASIFREQMDAAAQAIKDVKFDAEQLHRLSEVLRETMERMESKLRLIAEVDSDARGFADRQRISSRLRRLREMRNEMELGSFVIEVTNKMDEAWRRLP